MTVQDFMNAFFFLGLILSSLSAGISAGVWSRTRHFPGRQQGLHAALYADRAAQRTFFSLLCLMLIIVVCFVEPYILTRFENEDTLRQVFSTGLALIYLLMAWCSAVLTLDGWRDKKIEGLTR